MEQAGQVNRITYPLRVPGISGFKEFFIIVLSVYVGCSIRKKYNLILCSIHADKKGFAGDGELVDALYKEVFLCAKTDYYILLLVFIA